MNKIELNGEIYVKESDLEKQKAQDLDGMPYCIVRTYSAGVFAGYVEKREGKETVIRQARRLWKWVGAASLSQLATDGTKNPQECKFPCEVDKIIVTETIEILECTEEARRSIKEVEVWAM